jgi:transcription antitermination factor NusG
MNKGDQVRIKSGRSSRFSGMVGVIRHVISDEKVLVKFTGRDGVPLPNAIIRVENLELAE